MDGRVAGDTGGGQHGSYRQQLADVASICSPQSPTRNLLRFDFPPGSPDSLDDLGRRGIVTPRGTPPYKRRFPFQLTPPRGTSALLTPLSPELDESDANQVSGRVTFEKAKKELSKFKSKAESPWNSDEEEIANEDLREFLLDFMVLQGKEKTPELMRSIDNLILQGDERASLQPYVEERWETGIQEKSSCSSVNFMTPLKHGRGRGSAGGASQSTSCSLAATHVSSNRTSVETKMGKPSVERDRHTSSDDWELEFMMREALDRDSAASSSAVSTPTSVSARTSSATSSARNSGLRTRFAHPRSSGQAGSAQNGTDSLPGSPCRKRQPLTACSEENIALPEVAVAPELPAASVSLTSGENSSHQDLAVRVSESPTASTAHGSGQITAPSPKRASKRVGNSTSKGSTQKKAGLAELESTVTRCKELLHQCTDRAQKIGEQQLRLDLESEMMGAARDPDHEFGDMSTTCDSVSPTTCDNVSTNAYMQWLERTAKGTKKKTHFV